MRTPVPRFEPEVVQARADRQFGGNTDKVSTTRLEGIEFRGVKILSRYRKAHEIELMAAVVADLEPAQCACVDTLFCDSKATSFYEVHLRRRWFGDAKGIGDRICLSLLQRAGGYNGVHLHLPRGGEMSFGSDWAET